MADNPDIIKRSAINSLREYDLFFMRVFCRNCHHSKHGDKHRIIDATIPVLAGPESGGLLGEAIPRPSSRLNARSPEARLSPVRFHR